MMANLAELLEDYHRRRALGESTMAEDYRARAGDSYSDFLRILEAEAALDEAMGVPPGPVFPETFGEYTLLAELGRGAAGVVYEALHRGLGRKVALKILQTGFDTHPKTVERFKREARACAQIRHDHIVEIYEAGTHEGRHFYAMSLLEGKTLGEAARAGDLPGPRELARAVAGVADALHAMHEKGIVHRDVKPSNIMYDAQGRLVLADFGLARTVASETLTQTGDSLGTPLYMSPEQLFGSPKDINGRTDVYSLGATIYEVLSGSPVFRTNDMAALMRMVLRDRPKSLRTSAPQVPPGLARIVMKALEKRNEDRYETAAAMRDDLLAFARGDEVRGRPLSRTRRALRVLRRHAPWIAPAAAVLVAGAVWMAGRPGVVRLASIPRAIVAVNDEIRGETPVALELPPGAHTLVFRREGWKERRKEVQLAAGQRSDLEIVLQPEDPTDPGALRELARGLDLTLAEWEAPERTRGAPAGADVQLLFPRGRVRPADARRFRLVVEDGARGALVFRVDGEEVHRRPVDLDWPPRLDTTEDLPEAVVDALHEGARASWTFEPERGRPAGADFVVANADLAAIEARLGESDPRVREQLLAQALLDAGFAEAAYEKARAVALEHRAPVAYAIMKRALTDLGLVDTAPWQELLELAAR